MFKMNQEITQTEKTSKVISMEKHFEISKMTHGYTTLRSFTSGYDGETMYYMKNPQSEIEWLNSRKDIQKMYIQNAIENIEYFQELMIYELEKNPENKIYLDGKLYTSFEHDQYMIDLKKLINVQRSKSFYYTNKVKSLNRKIESIAKLQAIYEEIV